MFGPPLGSYEAPRKSNAPSSSDGMEGITEEIVTLSRFVMGMLAPRVVVGALAVLEEEFNRFYRVHRRSQEFRLDIEIIVDAFVFTRRSRTSNTFSLFAAALLHGLHAKKCLDVEEDKVKRAIQRSGLRLFKKVVQETASQHANNEVLQDMAKLETSKALLEQLQSWNHCFDFIDQDSDLDAFDCSRDTASATNAVVALNYIVDEDYEPYHDIIDLIEASIPLLEERIDEGETRKSKLVEEDMASLLEQIESANLG